MHAIAPYYIFHPENVANQSSKETNMEFALNCLDQAHDRMNSTIQDLTEIHLTPQELVIKQVCDDLEFGDFPDMRLEF